MDQSNSKSNTHCWKEEIHNSILVLEKSFFFQSFTKAVEFANKIAEIADKHDHHPELVISWGSVVVRWWSHDIGGISDRDKELSGLTDNLLDN